MNEPYTDKELRRFRRDDHRSPTILRFLATTARLQERVEEAEEDVRRWKKAKGESDSVIRRIVALVPRDVEQEDIFAAIERTVAERNEAEALAERRKKALEPFAAVLPAMPEVTDTWPDEMKLGMAMHLVPTIGDYRRARAAIEEGK